MATATVDWAELIRNVPTGAWVAISETTNSVLAHGSDAQMVLSEAQAKGEEHPLIFRVPDPAVALFV